MVSEERERFISEEDEVLKRLREEKLKKLMNPKEEKQEMSAEPVHMTDSSFDKIAKERPLALIDFWAAWCGPCKALEPTIEELAGEYAGKVFVGKLNVDENPVTAERFQVYSIPTVLVMKAGKEVDRIVGCVPKDYIVTALKKHLG
jgi:thioredoxin 1